MKIKEYPKVEKLSPNDTFIIDNDEEGTRQISQKNLPWGEGSVSSSDSVWVSHRNTYRGKYLGNVFTDEQKEAISSGTFEDLYVGDYWTINSYDWLIADINYWRTKKITTNHLVIVPRNALYKSVFNNPKNFNGGYANSTLRTQGLNTAKTLIYSSFGENYVMNHDYYIINSIVNNLVNGYIFITDAKVELMNQNMIFGNRVAQTSTIEFTNYPIQLAIFQLNTNLINPNSEGIWLTESLSDNSTLSIYESNVVAGMSNDIEFGVRPCFAITG